MALEWLRGRRAPLVRVRTARPPVRDLTDDRDSFYVLVHQAEAVRRNAPLQGNRQQTVCCWIEVAGDVAERQVSLFGRLFGLPRRPVWDRWVLWDQGPLAQLKLPTEEDVERERRLAGALRARVWLETTV